MNGHEKVVPLLRKMKNISCSLATKHSFGNIFAASTIKKLLSAEK